jgi:hypothetical protein
MTSRDFGGAFWEAEVDGVIDMGLRDPWPPDFAHCWLSEVDPLLSFAPRHPMTAANVSGRSLTQDSVPQRDDCGCQSD